MSLTCFLRRDPLLNVGAVFDGGVFMFPFGIPIEL
jgi:hypothetical protein